MGNPPVLAFILPHIKLEGDGPSHYTKRQKSYGNGFRVSADTETLLYTERNACPPGKKVVPNNRPANSDGHLVAGAADSSASEPPWDSARNNSIVASVPVWDHWDTNGFMAAWLTRRAKCSTVDLPTLTLPKTASAFVRLNSQTTAAGRDRHTLACGA
jgi:hypothetical protein